MTGSSSARPTQPGTKTFPEAAGEPASTQWRTRTERAPSDPPAGQRIEPSIDEHGFPSAASSAYEKLHGLDPDFGGGEFRRPPRSRLSRLAMMVGVFVAGAGVGLAAAMWLHKSPQQASIGATSSLVPSVPAASSADGRRAVAIRGISPSELPYDGAPPPATVQPSPAPVAIRIPPPAAADMASGASGADTVGERSAGTTQLESNPPPVSTPSKVAGMPAQGADSGADDQSKAKAVKQAGTSVANATPKRRNVTRGDREIERIRRQVDEELKKKTEHGRAPNDARPDAAKGARNENTVGRNATAIASMSRVSATRSSLAKCDRNTNFIRREFCRWKVCNGSWGRNGCPSYAPQNPTY